MLALHLTRKNQTKNKVVFGLGLLVALCGLAFTSNFGLQKVSAADCDSNAIIYCGTGTASQFIAQVKSNDSKNGHHDLQTVYAHYGLEPASYDQFVKTARPGRLYKDGRLVVDGQVVAQTNTNTIGRNASSQGAGYFTTNIGGTNYYGNTAGATFAAGTDSIGAMAMFNAKGVLQFAVLTSCGNPVGNTPTVPTYTCNELKKTAIPGQINAYNFTTSASAGNGASIAKVVYDFGDGSPAVTKTNPLEAVPHTYTKSGNWTAKVTVYVNLPGAQQATIVPGGGCQTTVTVVAPVFNCVSLAASVPDPRNVYLYHFVAATTFGNGATFNKVVYTFGDGSTQTATAVNQIVPHTFTKGGNWSVSAVLTVNLPAGGTASDGTGCKTTASTPIPVASCSTLTATVDQSDAHTYHFTTTAVAKNGAAVTKYVYNFGDKTTAAVTTASTTSTTTHKYGPIGPYTSTVTVYFTRHGDSGVTYSCTHKLSVITPLYLCVNLVGSFLDSGHLNTRYVATYQVENGPVPQTADFTFGDGSAATGVKPNTQASTFTADHAYTAVGAHSATASIHFKLNGKVVTAPTCNTECKPDVPQGSPQCAPCQYNVALPSNSPQCVPVTPPELPNTGAGDVVAIFGVVAVGGFLIYRQLLFRKHKSAFAAAQMGTSPLPLGQPLDDDAPLTGTPLAPKRRSFRRNKPF